MSSDTTRKRLVYFQVCVAVEAPPGTPTEEIEQAVDIEEVRVKVGDPVFSHGEPEVSFIESVAATW
jgi:hypothetical protein